VSTDQQAFAGLVLCLVNSVRTSYGRPALSPDASLTRAAQVHATEMTVEHYFAHESPQGQSNDERVIAAGYTKPRVGAWQVGENIEWISGATTPRVIVGQWLASPGHRANILTPGFRDSGVWVQPRTPYGGPGLTVAQVFGRHG
jgi:uncharacterized protein YkwD